MHGIVELILNSALLWIFLQATWTIILYMLYYFCVPWIVWGSFAIAIGVKLARIPPPPTSDCEEVLGLDPLICRKENSLCEETGTQYCMKVVAHRGGGFDSPENTLTAFRNCKEKGCTAVEFDVRLTKDMVPILFHDYTIDRVTGQSGFVSDMTWDQLKDLDVTYDHPLRHKFAEGDRITLFYDAVEDCLQNRLRIIIDIKETRPEMVRIIIDTYKKYPELYKKAMISSFNPYVIYTIRRKEPRIVCSLAWRPYYYTSISYSGYDGVGLAWYNNPIKQCVASIADVLYEWAFSRFVFYIVGVSAVVLHKDIVNQRVIQDWHDRGVRVMAWSVNLPSEKSHFSRLLRITYLTDTFVADKVM